MTADVYAGDDDLRAGKLAPSSTTRYCYRIEADPDADVLGRISNQLSFANGAPWSVSLVTQPDGRIVVEAELRGITDALAEFIRRKLQQQTCVVAVRLDTPD